MGILDNLAESVAKLADKTVDAASDAFEKAKKNEAFKNAADKVGDFREKAQSKANEAIESGKKRVEEMNLTKDLEKAQKQLGALVYTLAKTGEKNDDLVKQYVDDIASIEGKIEALKEKVEDFSIADIEKAADDLATSAAADVEEAAIELKLEGEDLMDKAEEEILDAIDAVETKADEVKGDLEELAVRAAVGVEELKEDVKEGVEDAVDAVEAAVDNAEEAAKDAVDELLK